MGKMTSDLETGDLLKLKISFAPKKKKSNLCTISLPTMLKILCSEFAPFATALCADERSCPGLKAVRNKLSLHTASLFGEGRKT